MKPESPAERPIHILLRLGGSLHGVDTVAEHEAVLRERGEVWFGKIGRTLGPQNIERLNIQVETAIPSFLFLTQREGKGYRVHRGELQAASKEIPAGEPDMTPPYYRKHDIPSSVGLWLKLGRIDLVRSEVLETLTVASSGMPVRDSMRMAIGAMFIVHESPGRYGPGDAWPS